jgi:transposase InsO family protein
VHPSSHLADERERNDDGADQLSYEAEPVRHLLGRLRLLVRQIQYDSVRGLNEDNAVERAEEVKDPSVIESWHSTVEFELRRLEHFATKAAARAKVAAWIEDYNTTRRHSALGMLSPLAYEQALAAGEAA